MSDLPQKERALTGILKDSLGVITRPTQTLRGLCQRKPFGRSLVVFLVVVVVPSLAGVVSRPFAFQAIFEKLGAIAPELPQSDLEQILSESMSIAAFIEAPLYVLVSYVAMICLYHLLSRLFKGKGTLGGLFTGFAFATVPLLFLTPVLLLPIVIGLTGVVLSALGALAITSWISVLQWIALRENYGFSSGRSLLVYSIPGIALILFLMMVLVAIILIAVRVGFGG